MKTISLHDQLVSQKDKEIRVLKDEVTELQKKYVKALEQLISLKKGNQEPKLRVV
jgi:hypothetical protein